MSWQEMQQFQEKHEAARSDDIFGTDQPHTSSVGMHQGNATDLPDDARRWIYNLPGEIDQQELDMLKQNSEVQQSQGSFGREKRVKKPTMKRKRIQIVSGQG